MYAVSFAGERFFAIFYLSPLFDFLTAEWIGRCHTVDANAGGLEEAVRGR
jgi:hypothetical protein